LLKRYIFIILLFSLSTATSQTRGKIESVSLNERDVLMMGENRKGPYFLPDSLIVEQSEKVFLDGIVSKNNSYKIDYIKGEIRFASLIADSVSIRLLYKVFPYDLSTEYVRHPLVTKIMSTSGDSTLPSAPSTQQEEYAANLSKSGSITRGVTVGNNRGLKVNSALNLNVNGKVGEQVEVIAALTDQTTPIQPEGTTQNLQEIDKVFIQIKAPYFSTTMGDFQIDYSETQFANYNRKLQGVMVQGDVDNFSIKASGAVSRGKYYSMKFMGQEGNQGPYQLKGDRGQIDIIILAGTERVYIDGEQMIRGETNDYIIDYAAAQITFTRKRLITADSRITVDFQYSDEQYRRNLYSAAARASLWKDRVQIETRFIQEADDKNNPLDFTLTDDYREILQQAGDAPVGAFVDGAVQVESGKGRYILQDSVYVYVGEENGNFNVSFSDLGDNQADYKYKGAGIYEYVGANQGRYAPVILLPTPKKQSVMDVDLSIEPVRGIKIGGELAISEFDKNTFSSLDAQDNQGVAQQWRLSATRDSLRFLGRNFGQMTLSGHYKSVDAQFTDIDRTEQVEYNRKWDLPDNTTRQERVSEYALTYKPLQNWNFTAQYGEIKKGDTFRSNRKQLESSLNGKRLPSYSYRIEDIANQNNDNNQSNTWLRQKGKVNYTVWKIEPFIEYENEIKKENWNDSLQTGFRFSDYVGGLAFQPFSKLNLSARYAQRSDDDYKGIDQFERKSKSETQTYRLELQQFKSLNATLDYTHRTRSYFNSTESNTRTDLAELKTRFTPWKRMVNANLNYQISSTGTAKKERVYIQVSQGDGNYRFDEDLNEYVYDPLGDYILRVLATDDIIPVLELKTVSRVRIEPTRLLGKAALKKGDDALWKYLVKALSTETYASVEERTQSDNFRNIYFMRLETFQDAEQTIMGSLQLRQDVYLFERNRDFNIRFRYRSREELNNQYLEGGENRQEKESSARVTTRFSKKISSQTEYMQKQAARFFDYSGRQNRDIESSIINTELSFRPFSKMEIALKGRYSDEQDRVYKDPTRVKSWALSPRLNYSFTSRGRLRSEFEYSNVSATPNDRILPYEMANGRSIGQSIRWDIRFDYRFSDVIMATFSYTGRNEPQRDRVIHTGRAQITAAFR